MALDRESKRDQSSLSCRITLVLSAKRTVDNISDSRFLFLDASAGEISSLFPTLLTPSLSLSLSSSLLPENNKFPAM